MYDELGYFDGAPHHPNVENSTMPSSLVDSSSSNDCLDPYAAADMGFGRLHHQLGFDMMSEIEAGATTLPAMQNASWDICYNSHLPGGQTGQHMYPAVPDLLNLLELPRCAGNRALFENSISFDQGMSMLYEQGMGNIPAGQEAGVLRELFGGLPQSYGVFCGGEEREGEGQFEGVVDYGREMGNKGEVMKGNFATERQRRVQMNGKFNALRSLVPVPTKPDRASIISDAIDYIKELLRTVDELKLLVDKKRRGWERSKKLKAEDREASEAAAGNMESSTTAVSSKDDHENTINGPLRSSWLQRRSKETFVDVRIIEDEVNIKLTQKKKASALLFAATALDELRLDLNHVAGGNIGDYHIFMFNAKICEGSSVYAGAVANKLLEAMARQCTHQNVHP